MGAVTRIFSVTTAHITQQRLVCTEYPASMDLTWIISLVPQVSNMTATVIRSIISPAVRTSISMLRTDSQRLPAKITPPSMMRLA